MHHLIHIVDEKTALAMDHDLRGGTAWECDDGTSQRHCLDHNHAKGLLPTNRVEKTTRTTEQMDLLLLIDRTNVGNLLSINLWLDLMLKIVHCLWHISINNTR